MCVKEIKRLRDKSQRPLQRRPAALFNFTGHVRYSGWKAGCWDCFRNFTTDLAAGGFRMWRDGRVAIKETREVRFQEAAPLVRQPHELLAKVNTPRAAFD